VKNGTNILLESQPGARLTAKNDDGSFRIVLITEGEGSTGVYGAEVMNEHSASVFENIGSHPNHPADATRPDQRSPLGLIGRITDVVVGEDGGKAALIGNFHPGNADIAAYVEEFQDLLAFSIYCAAFGQKNDKGKTVVESFDGSFPYRSVDLVLAAGRGGRFQLAQESLLAIESSLGVAAGTQPGSTPAPGSTHQKDISMDEQAIKALGESLATAVTTALKPLTDFVQEQKTAAEAAAAGAKPADAPNAVESAITALDSINKIDGIELIPTLKESLIAAVKAGEDVTAGIALATSVAAEAKTAKGAAKPAAPAIPGSYVAAEAATGSTPSAKSWTVAGLGGK